jgi:hypothetical protein
MSPITSFRFWLKLEFSSEDEALLFLEKTLMILEAIFVSSKRKIRKKVPMKKMFQIVFPFLDQE